MAMISTFTQFRSDFATSSGLLVDGYERWPVDNIGLNGFAPTWTGITKIPFTMTVQVSLDGSANGAMLYRSYLSQRTDDATKQYLLAAETTGKTGTWSLLPTALAIADLELAIVGPGYLIDTEEKAAGLFRDVTLYVQRLSDDSIGMLHFLPRVLGSY